MKIEIFSPLHRILLYYPLGKKFTQNRSISYSFRDIHTFPFSLNSRWPPKVVKIEILPSLHRILLYYSVGQRFTQNRSISYSFRDIHTFPFSLNPRWPPKVVKIEIFPLCIGYSCTTLRVKNSLKIALSRTVFEIFSFPFSSNPRWPPKVAKIAIFPPLHKIFLYYPIDQNSLAKNRSILFGFRDVHTFSFSAKIQDGCQKWRKLKFFPL